MGNCPTPLRRAIRENDAGWLRRMLAGAGNPAEAAKAINEDHAPDCILESCSPTTGNAFYYAVDNNRDLAIIAVLLEYGADVHSTGNFGETCLHCAARTNNVEMVKMLIKAGCDLYATDDFGSYSLHSAALSVFNSTNTVRYLVEEAGKREDVNLRDFNGRTPLHNAAYNDKPEVAKLFIEYGADINAVSKQGLTPLQCAPHQNSSIYRLLKEMGAKENVKEP